MVTTPTIHSVYRFLRLQLLIATSLALLVFLNKSSAEALQVMMGAMVALAGGVAYISILCKKTATNPVAILRLHIMAELAKLSVMFLVAAGFYLLLRQVDWFWVVAGFFATYSAYWLGLLIKN